MAAGPTAAGRSRPPGRRGRRRVPPPHPGLLGGQVRGRSEHRAHLRDAGLLGRPGDTEVGELDDVVLRHQQVAGLHVAVHHAVAVGVVEPERRLADDVQRRVDPQHAAVAQQLGARGTVDQLHHDEVLARGVVEAEVVHLHDVGVHEPRRREGLPAEARDEGLVLGQVLRQQLDRHLPLEARVEGAVDGRHAADPQAALEAIAAVDDLRAHAPPLPLPLLRDSWPDGVPPLFPDSVVVCVVGGAVVVVGRRSSWWSSERSWWSSARRRGGRRSRRGRLGGLRGLRLAALRADLVEHDLEVLRERPAQPGVHLRGQAAGPPLGADDGRLRGPALLLVVEGGGLVEVGVDRVRVAARDEVVAVATGDEEGARNPERTRARSTPQPT